jgi:hypothetical protein
VVGDLGGGGLGVVEVGDVGRIAELRIAGVVA